VQSTGSQSDVIGIRNSETFRFWTGCRALLGGEVLVSYTSRCSPLKLTLTRNFEPQRIRGLPLPTQSLLREFRVIKINSGSLL
jgi:hypothetical protein